MQEITLIEASKNLPELIEAVISGEEIIIINASQQQYNDETNCT